MRLAWLVLALASAAAAAVPGVEIVRGGQYYHRIGHLTVDDPEPVALDRAVHDGFAPCPECAPPRLSGGQVVDRGPSPHFRAELAERRAGTRYEGVLVPATAVALPAEPAPTALRDPAPAARAAPPAAVYDLPADGIPVPGTGGLLKVPTFKGSGGIIAIPYPMGGYGIVQPPYPTAPAAPPASDPAPSGR